MVTFFFEKKPTVKMSFLRPVLQRRRLFTAWFYQLTNSNIGDDEEHLSRYQDRFFNHDPRTFEHIGPGYAMSGVLLHDFSSSYGLSMDLHMPSWMHQFEDTPFPHNISHSMPCVLSLFFLGLQKKEREGKWSTSSPFLYLFVSSLIDKVGG